MTKLRHYDDEGTARFVTFNTYRDGNYLLEAGVPELFLKQLADARSKHNLKLFGYVIMPNHVHLVLLSPPGTKLGLVIGEVKSKMAREYFAGIGRPQLAVGNSQKVQRVFWQKRCYDHNCRSTAVVKEKIEYCHSNPVRGGLVGSPGDYTWSSYNWYMGKNDVPLDMDECGL